MRQNKLTIILISVLSLLLSSCAQDIQSSSYTEAGVGEASFTYQGKIISARKVTVKAGDKLEQNSTGIGLGALGGGVVGSQFGGGGGNLAATIGGAILGGVGGAFAEKKLKTQDAMEYVVKLTNGQILTTVQGLDAIFSIGQPVMIITSHNGRSRIIADSSVVQDVQAPLNAPNVNIKKVR